MEMPANVEYYYNGEWVTPNLWVSPAYDYSFSEEVERLARSGATIVEVVCFSRKVSELWTAVVHAPPMRTGSAWNTMIDGKEVLIKRVTALVVREKE